MGNNFGPRHFNHESVGCVSQSDNNDFVICIKFRTYPSSKYSELYLKYYIINQPIHHLINIRDEADYLYQGRPDIAWGNDSTYIVVWMDQRNTVEESGYNIYGQFFHSPFNKILKNFRINTPNSNFAYFPEVEFRENRYQVSWSSYSKPKRRYDTYINQWYLNITMTI